jgi:hypothetical protein
MRAATTKVFPHKVVLTACTAAVLAACHYAPKEEENAVPRTDEYKERIQNFVRNELTDPTGIRDAFITEPVLRPVGRNTTRYVVCFKFNAKDNNDAQRYVGTKEVAAIFYNGRISQFTGATPELCGNTPYQPYPELQALCREVVCPRPSPGR